MLSEAIAAARRAGTWVALDTSGPALSDALSQPADLLPHVIKPNGEELAELTGRTLETIGDVADAAAVLLERGVRTVLVSLGADGAVLVQDGLRLHGLAPVARVVNTVGAGDAFLAGYLAASHDAGTDGSGGSEARRDRLARTGVRAAVRRVRRPAHRHPHLGSRRRRRGRHHPVPRRPTSRRPRPPAAPVRHVPPGRYGFGSVSTAATRAASRADGASWPHRREEEAGVAIAVVDQRGGGRGRRKTAAPFSPERHEHILTTLRHDGRIDAAALAAVLEVSTETVRKDLIGLEARGLLQRVHGGAVPVGGHSFEPEVSTRTEYVQEKRRIAAAAVAHVPRSGSVLIDAGSTTAELAAVFPHGRDLTVFTNALTIAMTLATKDGLTVVPLGGQLRRPTSATVGAWTCRALEEINVDVAFLGTNGSTYPAG